MRFGVLFLTLVLTGCTASGPLYTKPESSSIVVYREDKFYLNTRNIEVGLDGKQPCKLHNASYYVYPNPKDEVNISASMWDFPGTTRGHFAVDEDTIYIKLGFDSDTQASTMILGVLGTALAEKNGPFTLTQIPEKQALQDLKALHQDCI